MARRLPAWRRRVPAWVAAVFRIEAVLPCSALLIAALVWCFVIDKLRTDERAVTEAATAESLEIAAMFEQRTLRAIQAADRTTLLIKYLFERDGRVDLHDVVARGLIPGDAYVLTSLVDVRGRVVASSEPRAVDMFIGDRDYFNRHRLHDTGALDISKPTPLRVSGKWAIQLTRRLNAPDGSFAGMILISVDPEFFTSWYDEARLGKSGLLALIGTDGVIRARRVGLRPGGAFEGTSQGILAAAVESPSGVYPARSRFDGIERLVAFQHVSNFPLIVVAGQAKRDVFEPFERYRMNYLVASTLITSLILAFFAITTVLAHRLKASRARAWARAADLRLASTVFETTADAVVLTDADDRIVMVNPAFTALTRVTERALVGTDFASSPLGPANAALGTGLRGAAERDGRASREVIRRMPGDGPLLDLRVTITCVRNGAGQVTNYVRVFTDISALKQSQQALENLARCDPLTGLLNRRAFNDVLRALLVRAAASARTIGLLFVDLDEFKELNDTMGHDAGDEALRLVAQRLKRSVRDTDVVSRFGGDEFTIILDPVWSEDQLALAIARVRSAFEQPFAIGDASVPVNVSIGAALSTAAEREPEQLIARADAAMYREKRAHRKPAGMRVQGDDHALEPLHDRPDMRRPHEGQSATFDVEDLATAANGKLRSH